MMRAVAWLALLPLAAQGAPGNQTKVCATCHPAQAKAHAQTLMARTLEPGNLSGVLQEKRELKLKFGDYGYRIHLDGDRSLYTVTNDAESRTGTVEWVVGQGVAGQTYVVEREGKLYESRVSYYNKVQGLDATIGSSPDPPKNFDDAFGREMPSLSVTECFTCHSSPQPETNGSPPQKGTLAWTRTLNWGVQCENCHRGAWKHAAARMEGDMKTARLPRLKQITTEEMADLCGACHRTWANIQVNGPHGVANVRFQPYRIVHSKCYDALDRRIACTSCHDPHNRPENAVTNYDSACKACHQTAASSKAARICKVSQADCVSCHMPKYEIPGSHFKFADHFIRIVRANETYPD